MSWQEEYYRAMLKAHGVAYRETIIIPADYVAKCRPFFAAIQQKGTDGNVLALAEYLFGLLTRSPAPPTFDQNVRMALFRRLVGEITNTAVGETEFIIQNGCCLDTLCHQLAWAKAVLHAIGVQAGVVYPDA